MPQRTEENHPWDLFDAIRANALRYAITVAFCCGAGAVVTFVIRL